MDFMNHDREFFNPYVNNYDTVTFGGSLVV